MVAFEDASTAMDTGGCFGGCKHCHGDLIAGTAITTTALSSAVTPPVAQLGLQDPIHDNSSRKFLDQPGLARPGQASRCSLAGAAAAAAACWVYLNLCPLQPPPALLRSKPAKGPA